MQSGLTAAHLTVGAMGTMTPLQAFENIVRDIARWERQIESHPDVLSRVQKILGANLLRLFGETWS